MVYNKPLNDLTKFFNCDSAVLKTDELLLNQILMTAERVLEDNKIECNCTEVLDTVTNVILHFQVRNYAVKYAKIKKLEESMNLFLGVHCVTITQALGKPGQFALVIPKDKRPLISLGNVLSTETYSQLKSDFKVAIGLDEYNNPVVFDLKTNPHLLIGGASGSGKSTVAHSIITSILMNATLGTVKFVLIDPKQVEFKRYKNVGSFLYCEPITQMYQASDTLYLLRREMDKRYSLIEEKDCEDIDEYNQIVSKPLCRIVIVIDEFADLMSSFKAATEKSIQLLSQKGRACGIHLIIATQRPCAQTINSTIKTNFASRIALQVPSGTNSRIILDRNGAENLLGRGDALFLNGNTNELVRFQSSIVTTGETKKVIDYIQHDSLGNDSTDNSIITL